MTSVSPNEDGPGSGRGRPDLPEVRVHLVLNTAKWDAAVAAAAAQAFAAHEATLVASLREAQCRWARVWTDAFRLVARALAATQADDVAAAERAVARRLGWGLCPGEHNTDSVRAGRPCPDCGAAL